MRTFLMRAAGAAGAAYMATHMIYGGAEYADFGVAQVSVEPLLKFIPAIAGVLVPLVASKWPVAAKLLTLLLDVWKYKSPAKADMLAKVAALEVHAKESGSEQMTAACAALRTELVK